MLSQSCSPSPESDGESAIRLEALKAQLEAETRAAEAKKVQKEQERQERREQQQHEKAEREEWEHREHQEALRLADRESLVEDWVHLAEEAERVVMAWFRGVWEAVAGVT